jgi:hypothetical protein
MNEPPAGSSARRAKAPAASSAMKTLCSQSCSTPRRPASLILRRLANGVRPGISTLDAAAGDGAYSASLAGGASPKKALAHSMFDISSAAVRSAQHRLSAVSPCSTAAATARQRIEFVFCGAGLPCVCAFRGSGARRAEPAGAGPALTGLPRRASCAAPALARLFRHHGLLFQRLLLSSGYSLRLSRWAVGRVQAAFLCRRSSP